MNQHIIRRPIDPIIKRWQRRTMAIVVPVLLLEIAAALYVITTLPQQQAYDAALIVVLVCGVAHVCAMRWAQRGIRQERIALARRQTS